jgi:hypothetical protein
VFLFAALPSTASEPTPVHSSSGGPRNFPKPGRTRLNYQILDKIAI